VTGILEDALAHEFSMAAIQDCSCPGPGDPFWNISSPIQRTCIEPAPSTCHVVIRVPPVAIFSFDYTIQPPMSDLILSANFSLQHGWRND
jgi:hypothetical protein